jgi:uncharacterized membrane protein YphA (DoxX/SURF4 family)
MMQSAPFNYRRIVILLGRLFLAGVFIYAGYAKLTNPNHPQSLHPFFVLKFQVLANLDNFAKQVDAFKLLPESIVPAFSHALPFVEIGLGLLLLIGWQVRIWSAFVTLILAMFFTVVTRAYLLHMDINCGCFATPEKITLLTLLRDGSMLALSVLVTVFAFQEARKPHPWTAEAASSSLKPASRSASPAS